MTVLYSLSNTKHSYIRDSFILYLSISVNTSVCNSSFKEKTNSVSLSIPEQAQQEKLLGTSKDNSMSNIMPCLLLMCTKGHTIVSIVTQFHGKPHPNLALELRVEVISAKFASSMKHFSSPYRTAAMAERFVQRGLRSYPGLCMSVCLRTWCAELVHVGMFCIHNLI